MASSEGEPKLKDNAFNKAGTSKEDETLINNHRNNSRDIKSQQDLKRDKVSQNNVYKIKFKKVNKDENTAFQESVKVSLKSEIGLQNEEDEPQMSGGKFQEDGEESENSDDEGSIPPDDGELEGKSQNRMRNEIDELKEFLVLDEVEHDSEEEYNSASNSDSGEDDLPNEEIEAMLDEGLPEDYKGERKKKECPYNQRQKIVLEEKGVNHFEVLPLGWLVVPHNSGIPLYLHKPSRVCSLAKPYFLGPGSARKHEIPVSAIPCLNYRRALEEEVSECLKDTNTNENGTNIPQTEPNVSQPNGPIDQNAEEKTDSAEGENCSIVISDRNEHAQDVTIVDASQISDNPNNGESTSQNILSENGTKRKVANPELLKKLMNYDALNGDSAPKPLIANARVETAQENWTKFHLKHDEVMDYCKKLFKFKRINIMRFKSWSERRKFTKTRKALQRPTLPDGTKLITFPVQTMNTDGTPQQGALSLGPKMRRKECLMNPSGKSYVCILHEYLQRALKKQPTYEFKELENGATPYSATVSISGMRYGVGYGTSKRQAKSAAAKSAIEILIPEMRDKIKQDSQIHGTASRSSDRDLAFFDDIAIEDPRVADFCAKTMEPSPHNVLQTCLDRNFGIGDREIKFNVNTLKHQWNQFSMTVGKHTATVVCRNKRDGKQRASQAILQALHPNITSWGSLLRLYGTRSVKSFKEKKQEEQQITLLQSKAAVNQPNHAILDKLKEEMDKLSEIMDDVKPIGTMVVEEALPVHSGSNLNNVEL